MRIVFDVSHIQKGRAGIGRYTTEILKALLAVDSHNEYLLHGWSYSLDQDFINTLRRDNVTLSTARIPGPIRRFYWNGLKTPALTRLLGPFDLFHSSEHFLPPLETERAVVTVYDLASQKYPDLFESRVIRWNRRLRGCIARADAVIVPSVNTKSDLMEILSVPEENIHVVCPPVSAMFVPEGRGGEDQWPKMIYGLERPFVLFVGTLEPRKNIAALIRAFESLCQQLPDEQELDLVLAGKKGWLFEDILKTIGRSPQRERIVYLDYVPDAELPALYRQSEFMVYPSLYEGYGFPVVEAMACGTPVITSNTSPMQEVAGGAAILVDPADTEGLAGAMLELVVQPSERDGLTRLGLEQAKRYSAATTAESVLQLYDGLVP
jgi:glycosyltransferase involved in cell wall biosynthesis